MTSGQRRLFITENLQLRIFNGGKLFTERKKRIGKKIAKRIFICTLLMGMIALATTAVNADTKAKDAFLASGYAKSTTNVIKWSAVDGAQGYDVYFAKCGKNYKKVKTTAELKYTKKSLSKTSIYKYKVKAFNKIDGKKNYIAATPAIHIAGVKVKYSNAKAVAINSDDIAMTIDANGQITAVSAGTAYVYAFATNAGSYTVYYKVVGDKSYEDIPETAVQVRISRASQAISAPTAPLKQGSHTR